MSIPHGKPATAGFEVYVTAFFVPGVVRGYINTEVITVEPRGDVKKFVAIAGGVRTRIGFPDKGEGGYHRAATNVTVIDSRPPGADK